MEGKMIKKQIENMKNNSIEDLRHLYENISLKMPPKNYAMFDLLSRIGNKPKSSMLSKDISYAISEIITSESELIDIIENILNSIPKSHYQGSFVEIIINQGLACESMTKTNNQSKEG